MADDKLEFLDSEQPEEKTKDAPEVEVEPVEAKTEAPPIEVESESKGEEEAAPPAAEQESRHIPVTALLDEREKRQAAQREAEDAIALLEEKGFEASIKRKRKR